MKTEAPITEERMDHIMKIIVINGPMGVGKTTVGKRVADSLPGTAFIDGDWCMDLHPFVGSPETRAMAADNILHMAANYLRCSVCRMVVVVWLMDDPAVAASLTEGLSALGAEVVSVTLVCGREQLIRRWKNDRECEWRTEKWLESSLRSLPAFAAAENAIDTSALSPEQAADRILEIAAGE